ncbi:MAG: DUF4097 family beta strand repeat-containing protein [Anaerovoracaceae bacterium]
MRKKLFCVVVLICMVCMLFLTGCVAHFNGGISGSTFDYADAETYTVGGGSADAAVKNLEIEWLSGKVNVTVSESDSILLEETANKELPDDLIMRWKQDGDTLRVKFCNVGTWQTNGLEKELTVTIPKGLELDVLEIETVSADISAPQIKADAVDCETVSGDVEIAVNRVNLLQAETVSGSIIATAEEFQETELDTTSGEIRLNLARVSGDCEIGTVSGHVTLAVPGRSDFAVRYDTVSGEMESEISLKKDGDEFLCGSGKHTFRIDTTSGSLTILENK